MIIQLKHIIKIECLMQKLQNFLEKVGIVKVI